MNLNEYFYICYKNMKNPERESYGQIIFNKLSNMLSIISKMYFSSYNQNEIEKLYLISKDTEFHIRICYKLHILQKKQITNLSK